MVYFDHFLAIFVDKRFLVSMIWFTGSNSNRQPTSASVKTKFLGNMENIIWQILKLVNYYEFFIKIAAVNIKNKQTIYDV